MLDYEVGDDDVSVHSSDSIRSFDSLGDPVEDNDLANEEYLKNDGKEENDVEDHCNLYRIKQNFISILERLDYTIPL